MAQEKIKVVVHGAGGRMGREVLLALCRDDDVDPVGAVDVAAREEYLSLPDNSGLIPYGCDIEPILIRCRPHVVVDFSTAEATRAMVPVVARHGVNMVIGTTGLGADDLAEIRRVCEASGVGAFVAPNFALGAVLMMQMAKLAARFMDYAEVIELHHEQKIDAPSGTAVTTARDMARARGKPFIRPPTLKETVPGSRGADIDGVTVHSVRLPGLVAHQEVIFGGLGQTLSIRHDSVSRESFIPGVMLALKQVSSVKGLVVGLENLLGLGGDNA